MKTRFLAIIAASVIAVTLTAAGAAAMWPTPGAKDLHEQIEVVTSRMQPLMAWAGHDLEILPTRDNKLSVFFAGEGVARSLTGEGAANAIDPRTAGKCLVIVSATNQAVLALAAEMHHVGLSWRFLMTHEIAHCVRNPEMELRLVDGVIADPRLLIAAKYAGEAYADSMAVIDLWSQDAKATINIARAAEAWRMNPTLAMPWRTANAIELLLKKLPESGISDLKADPEARDRLAWEVAIESLPAQAQALGINAASLDLNRIAMLGRIPSSRH